MQMTIGTILRAIMRPRLDRWIMIYVWLLTLLSAGAMAQQLDADKLGHLGGVITAVAARDHYAYIGQGTALRILDMADPARPVEIGSADLPDQFTTPRITLDGNMAYAVLAPRINTYQTSDTLTIFDLSDPTAPRRRGSININGWSWPHLAVSGGLACWSNGTNQVSLIDVSNPDRPTLINQISLENPANDVALQNGLAYILSPKQFDIYDVHDPLHPAPRGKYQYNSPNGSGLQHLLLANSLAYLVGAPQLVILNLDNPDNPSVIGSITTDTNTKYDACLLDGRIVITTDGYNLRFYDVQNPAAPVDKGSFQANGYFPYFLACLNKTLLCPRSNYGEQDLNALDLTDPAAPRPFVSYHSPDLANLIDINTSGTTAYAITQDRLHKLDLSRPGRPALLGTSKKLPDTLTFSRVEHTDDGRVLIAGLTNGVHMYDVNQPSSPSLLVTYYAREYLPSITYHAVSPAHQLVYAANDPLGVLVLDISRPTSPTLLRKFADGGTLRDIAVGGGLACVVDTTRGVLVYDITDPANPVQKNIYKPDYTTSIPKLVAMSGRTACVVFDDGSIIVFDLTNPASPRTASGNPIDNYGARIPITAMKMEIKDGILYVHGRMRGRYSSTSPVVALIDIRNPGKPIFLGSMPIPQKADITDQYVISNGLVFSYGRVAGLWLQRIVPPVQVISPNGGERVAGGTGLPVHWRNGLKSGGTGARLELWNGQGRVTVLGEDWNTSGEDTKTFRLPLVPEAGDYRIRAISLWNEDFTDESDAPFTITGGTVRLSEPAGGETWVAGVVQYIHWQTTPQFAGTAVLFELWRDGHKVADLGAADDPRGEARSPVTIPLATAPGDYVVRAVSAWNPAWFTESAPIVIRNDHWTGSAVAPESWSAYP